MATEKVTIGRISHLDKDRDGNKLVNKQGKPYTRCLLDTTDGRKLSGFGSQATSNWGEGTEVDIEITTVEKDGKTYYNFSVPKKGDVDMTDVHQKLDEILSILKKKEDHNDPHDF